MNAKDVNIDELNNTVSLSKDELILHLQNPAASTVKEEHTPEVAKPEIIKPIESLEIPETAPVLNLGEPPVFIQKENNAPGPSVSPNPLVETPPVVSKPTPTMVKTVQVPPVRIPTTIVVEEKLNNNDSVENNAIIIENKNYLWGILSIIFALLTVAIIIIEKYFPSIIPDSIPKDVLPFVEFASPFISLMCGFVGYLKGIGKAHAIGVFGLTVGTIEIAYLIVFNMYLFPRIEAATESSAYCGYAACDESKKNCSYVEPDGTSHSNMDCSSFYQN